MKFVIPFSQAGGRSPSRGRSAEDARDRRVTKAIAAAAAIRNPPKALEVEHHAREEPWRLGLSGGDRKALAPVLSAVSEADDERPDASLEKKYSAVARAAGADPALVKVALDELSKSDKAVRAALRWAASLDRTAVAAAARSAQKIGFDLIPDVEDRLKAVEDGLEELSARVDALEKGGASGSGPSGI